MGEVCKDVKIELILQRNWKYRRRPQLDVCLRLLEHWTPRENVMNSLEQGSFKTIAMFTNRGFSKDCKKFCVSLAELIANKRNERYSKASSGVNQK